MTQRTRSWLSLTSTFIPIILAGCILFVSRDNLIISSSQPASIETLLTYLIALVLMLAINEVIHRHLVLDRVAQTTSESAALIREAATNLTEVEKSTLETGQFVRAATAGHLGSYFLKERSEFPDFYSRVRDAKEIWFLGTSLDQIVSIFFEVLLDKARRGCRMRFLLMDPNCDAVSAKSHGLFMADTPDRLRSDIIHASTKIDDIRSEQMEEGQISKRHTSFVPTYAMLLVDPNTPGGQIVVEIYPYLVTAEGRPHFELRATDSKWFTYFRRQFIDLWGPQNP